MKWWPLKQKARPLGPEDLILELFGRRNTKSGLTVTVKTALQVAAVLGCTRVLAEDVAKIPLKLYREREGGKGADPAREDHRYRLIWRRPNAWQTSFEFREMLMYHAVLSKGGYAIKNVVRGELRELIPVQPHLVRVLKTEAGEPAYEIRDENGTGIVGTFSHRDMFVLRGPSWDGFIPMEAIDLAREAIGLAASAEESQAQFHANGTQAGGVLTTDQHLKQEAIQKIRDAFQKAYGGGKNAYRTIMLDAGFKFTPMTVTGVDAQQIETRRFQVEEICRAMRVYPQKVMHSDKATTYASAEQFSIDHVIDSIVPWVERWEQALDRDILKDEETDLFTKFTVSALLRGDAKSRADYYTKAITNGWMTRNEVRELEELNPLEGLDEPLTPLNMTDTQKVGNDGQETAA